MNGTNWTGESVTLTTRLWAEGSSARQIVAELFQQYGISTTRCAVLGKLHRLGLNHRAKPPSVARAQPQKRRARRSRTLGAEPLPPLMPAADIPPQQRKQLLKLKPHHCRWPYGDPDSPDFFFCGAPEADMLARRPYCPYHASIAYRGRGEMRGFQEAA